MTEHKDLYLKLGEALLSMYTDVGLREPLDMRTRTNLKEHAFVLLRTYPQFVATEVVCDETNNPPSVVEDRNCVLDVWVELDGQEGAHFCVSVQGCTINV